MIGHIGDPQQALPPELEKELATAREVVEGELLEPAR